VEENDYTVFTCQDLEFELELVVHAVGKKIVFIDNQVWAFLISFFLVLTLTFHTFFFFFGNFVIDRLPKHDKPHPSPT